MGNKKTVLRGVVHEVIKSFVHGMTKNGIRQMSTVIEFCTPYLMYAIAIWCYGSGDFTIGLEVLIPIVGYMIVLFLRQLANKLNTGHNIPKPIKRFTIVSDGMVRVEKGRLQEMLVYMADFEDWLERKGML